MTYCCCGLGWLLRSLIRSNKLIKWPCLLTAKEDSGEIRPLKYRLIKRFPDSRTQLNADEYALPADQSKDSYI